MVETFFVAFLCFSIASIIISLWDAKSAIIKSVILSLVQILSILKVFGIALLIIISIGIGIALWEQVFSKPKYCKFKTNSTTPSNYDMTGPVDKSSTSLHRTSIIHQSIQAPSENDLSESKTQRSILPIALVVTGLMLFSLIDRSSLLFHSSSHPIPLSSQPNLRPPRLKETNSNRSVVQFFLAVLTLAIVVAFIVFNKDEYRAWKARRKLYKNSRRIARHQNIHHSTQ